MSNQINQGSNHHNPVDPGNTEPTNVDDTNAHGIFITVDEFDAIQQLKSDYDRIQQQLQQNDGEVYDNELMDSHTKLIHTITELNTRLQNEINIHTELKSQYTQLYVQHNTMQQSIQQYKLQFHELNHQIESLQDICTAYETRQQQSEATIQQLNDMIQDNNMCTGPSSSTAMSTNRSIELTIALQTIKRLECELHTETTRHQQLNERYTAQHDAIIQLKQSIEQINQRHQYVDNTATMDDISTNDDNMALRESAIQIELMNAKHMINQLNQHNQSMLYNIYKQICIVSSGLLIFCVVVSYIV